MKKYILHILFWIVFFLIWQRVVYFYVDNRLNALLFSAFDISLVILAFYSIFFLITPVYLARKNKWYFVIGGILSVLIPGLILTVVMNMFLARNIVPIRFNFSWKYNDLVANRYFIALLGATAGFITRLSLNWLAQKKKMEHIERERINAELVYLKNQLNPHFLFNAINTIYIQMDLSKEEARHTLHTFSEMLRYQLYECNAEKVEIEKEIRYIQNYVRLQGLRKDENCEIVFSYGSNPTGFLIAPLLLLPFVENMFKHVSNERDTINYIKGNIREENGWVIFYFSNTKNSTGERGAPPAGGIGLSNVKRRLELIYPGAHTLDINDSGKTYEVWLKIQKKS